MTVSVRFKIPTPAIANLVIRFFVCEIVFSPPFAILLVYELFRVHILERITFGMRQFLLLRVCRIYYYIRYPRVL